MRLRRLRRYSTSVAAVEAEKYSASVVDSAVIFLREVSLKLGKSPQGTSSSLQVDAVAPNAMDLLIHKNDSAVTQVKQQKWYQAS
jgi:hypothetical protein